ncbi:hypothetical protein C8F04DRAFT_1092373 [Mycena alexandri]|uniref:Secreted protein n=1 Tax=Mycena alexandri TaxID=1745969 RepID=A0AAD6T414_9AGAR|nr:hypothetical protein C8F04DRAFT_1092373 [Mycena alexandri]
MMKNRRTPFIRLFLSLASSVSGDAPRLRELFVFDGGILSSMWPVAAVDKFEGEICNSSGAAPNLTEARCSVRGLPTLSAIIPHLRLESRTGSFDGESQWTIFRSSHCPPFNHCISPTWVYLPRLPIPYTPSCLAHHRHYELSPRVWTAIISMTGNVTSCTRDLRLLRSPY